MINKLINFSVIFVFLLAPLHAAEDLPSFEKIFTTSSSSKFQSSLSSKSSLEAPHCVNCKNDGFSDGADCCISHCACIISLPLHSKEGSIINSKALPTKIDWYLFNNYLSPFLDPGLKPPLFS
jgi:hypothetical protein